MRSRETSNVAAPAAPDEQEAYDALPLIGAFADQCLPDFVDEELRQFERLLEEDDPVIDDWVTGRQSVPKEHDDRIMTVLREFRPLRTNRREE
jgi:succinate dehydrogenase flavin-adding protein (antitoxin of CptAB toxin-antitoxin module)